MRRLTTGLVYHAKKSERIAHNCKRSHGELRGCLCSSGYQTFYTRARYDLVGGAALAPQEATAKHHSMGVGYSRASGASWMPIPHVSQERRRRTAAVVGCRFPIAPGTTVSGVLWRARHIEELIVAKVFIFEQQEEPHQGFFCRPKRIQEVPCPRL